MHTQTSERPVARRAAAPAQAPVRRCACGGAVGADGECSACRARRLAAASAVQTGQAAPAPPAVTRELARPGQPLEGATRAFMEPRFGHSFADVRVHTGAEAADSARAVGARAYTVGRQVVFGAGEYSPGSAAGQRLLAHELAHVVQQSAGGTEMRGEPVVRTGADRYEHEADRAADRVVAGAAVTALTSLPARAVQRTMICSKRLEAPVAGWFANHSYVDDTGRDDCLGAGMVGNYAVTELVSGNFVRGCAVKTDRSPDPRGQTPNRKPCHPKPGVTDVSACLRAAYAAYADPSVYSNAAVTAGAAGGAAVGGVAGAVGGAAAGSLLGPVGTAVGGVLGGVVGAFGGALAGAGVASGANGPNSNTFAATLARACCDDASSSGLGWVPGWDHAPATPCRIV